MPDGPFKALWHPEVFVPLAMALNGQDGLHNLVVFGRLKSDVGAEQARDDGTYGLIACTVGRRTREFGIRMAMGSGTPACYAPARWAARVDPMVTQRAS